MADNQVRIAYNSALKIIPKTIKRIFEQLKITRQKDLFRSQILQKHWAWIQNSKISHRINLR